MQHTIVLGCSQFKSCIPLSKEKAKMKKVRKDFCVSKNIVIDRFTLQVNLGDKSGGV